MAIRKGRLILLSGKEKKYLTRAIGNFSCKYGKTDLKDLVGKTFGCKLQIGSASFTVLEPGVLDLLKFLKRGPQIILPKDSAAIASVTGCGVGWKVLDSGSGSGFNIIFLANLGCDVISVERDKNFFKLAGKNILLAKEVGQLKIEMKNASVEKYFRKDYFDLITLDLQNADKLVKNSFLSLKAGGWLAVYVMQAEDILKVSGKIKKLFGNVKILEVLNREWQFESFGEKTYTRPKTWMMGHSGFLIFGRKIKI